MVSALSMYFRRMWFLCAAWKEIFCGPISLVRSTSVFPVCMCLIVLEPRIMECVWGRVVEGEDNCDL